MHHKRRRGEDETGDTDERRPADTAIVLKRVYDRTDESDERYHLLTLTSTSAD